MATSDKGIATSSQCFLLLVVMHLLLVVMACFGTVVLFSATDSDVGHFEGSQSAATSPATGQDGCRLACHV